MLYYFVNVVRSVLVHFGYIEIEFGFCFVGRKCHRHSGLRCRMPDGMWVDRLFSSRQLQRMGLSRLSLVMLIYV